MLLVTSVQRWSENNLSISSVILYAIRLSKPAAAQERHLAANIEESGAG